MIVLASGTRHTHLSHEALHPLTCDDLRLLECTIDRVDEDGRKLLSLGIGTDVDRYDFQRCGDNDMHAWSFGFDMNIFELALDFLRLALKFERISDVGEGGHAVSVVCKEF